MCVSNRMYTYSHIYLCVQLHLSYIHLIPYTSHTNAYTNTYANIHVLWASRLGFDLLTHLERRPLPDFTLSFQPPP